MEPPCLPSFTMGNDTKAIWKRLLAWYALEARDLPWRNTRDPYAILVSEFMLQQTRVDTVLNYFERFLERFPSLEALAKAPIGAVLKAWEGLGYYRRAHNLHRTAQILIREHDGRLPESVDELRRLPGTGPYTAAAIASIAFDLDEPVLDGNVVRVVTRLFCIAGDPAKATTQKRLLREAKLLALCGNAAALNQALMDLGARVCLPRRPSCDDCPIGSLCDAHHVGRETGFPQKRKKSPIPRVMAAAGIIWDKEPFSSDAKLLIARRKADDMLGGLWEFPGGRVEDEESLEQALLRELREELAIDVDVIEPFLQIDHAYTHFRVTLHFFHCRHTGGEPIAIECDEWRWAGVDELDEFAFPTANRKVLAALTAQHS
ncbi:8-oxo-dGTP diphosphatase MutT [Candidatus Bipolaricaulota bacterium]